MPAGDRTGPMGMGPMTGRRAGFCAGYNLPGYANPMPRLGLRRGYCGAGRGWRHLYYATGLTGWQRAGIAQISPEQELSFLKEEANLLKTNLEAILSRIEALEAKEKKE